MGSCYWCYQGKKNSSSIDEWTHDCNDNISSVDGKCPQNRRVYKIENAYLTSCSTRPSRKLKLILKSHFCQFTWLPSTVKLGPSGWTMFKGFNPSLTPTWAAANCSVKLEFSSGIFGTCRNIWVLKNDVMTLLFDPWLLEECHDSSSTSFEWGTKYSVWPQTYTNPLLLTLFYSLCLCIEAFVSISKTDMWASARQTSFKKELKSSNPS